MVKEENMNLLRSVRWTVAFTAAVALLVGPAGVAGASIQPDHAPVNQKLETSPEASHVAQIPPRPHPYRDGPVQLDLRYDRATNGYVIHVVVTPPEGSPHRVGVSGHKVEGESITWNLVLGPIFTNVCRTLALFGLCQLT